MRTSACRSFAHDQVDTHPQSVSRSSKSAARPSKSAMTVSCVAEPCDAIAQRTRQYKNSPSYALMTLMTKRHEETSAHSDKLDGNQSAAQVLASTVVFVRRFDLQNFYDGPGCHQPPERPCRKG